MSKQFSAFVEISITLLVFSMFGCSKNSSTPVSSSVTVQPKGTITGLIKNRITSEPVPSAVISLSYDGTVVSLTSDSAGRFSFADVPASQYQTPAGGFVNTGTYTITASLVNYNSLQVNPDKKYRNYYYQTVQITFTSLGHNDSLTADDLVGSILLDISYLNTTVKGQVVDQNMQPTSALVTLYDETVVPGVAIAQDTTASDGSYIFKNVDDGLTINLVATSADGSQQGQLPFFYALPGNVTVDSLRAGVNAERIEITPVDQIIPEVINITPENNSDVSPDGLSIVYTFSEPIKQSSYTRTDLPVGSKTMLDDIAFNFIGMKKATDLMNFTAQWNSTFSQLTITPQGLVGSARYTLNMTGAFNSGKITNAKGTALADNPKITGDFDLLNFSTSGGTAAPNAPVLQQQNVPGTYGPLNYSGGLVGLEWNPDPSVRSYNVYKSVDGGPFTLLQTNYYDVQFQDNSGPLITPINYVPQNHSNPLGAGSVSYAVTAVSKDLVESQMSNSITVTDGVHPKLIGVTVVPAGANSWTYSLYFSEPLIVSSAEQVSDYSFLNYPDSVAFSINAANYLGYDATSGWYIVQLSATTAHPLPAGYALQVNLPGVTDLAQNPIDSTNADNVWTSSAPSTPILTSPNSTATNVGLPLTLMWQAASGATSYHLQISTVASFATTVVDQDGITSTTFTADAPVLTIGTLYYWRVSATNAAGTTAYSATWQFTP